MDPPFCLLCGVRCPDPQACRVTDTSSIQLLLRQRCAPTRLHYASVLALPSESRRPLCLACVNWKRRARNFSAGLRRPGRSRRRCFTPLDSVLLHALAPGHFPEPDQRCLLRLARAAADPANAYAACVPEVVRTVLTEAVRERQQAAPLGRSHAASLGHSRTTLVGRSHAAELGRSHAPPLEVLRAWWQTNERTSFFRHAETARAVRHTLLFPDPTQEGSRRRWRR